MQRNKQYCPDLLKHSEMSPKVPFKKPFPLRKKLLIAQASAHCAKRNYHQYPKNPGSQEHKQEVLEREKDRLSPEQIKSSAIYRLLEEEIKSLTGRQQFQVTKLAQIHQQKVREIETCKKEQHSIKLQIWELKNEALEIKDSIKEEKDETERLMDELGLDQPEDANISMEENLPQ